MENVTYASSHLRYLGAGDVDDSVVDYDGLAVVGPDGEAVGKVDGFIVDEEARRVHHVVVDSGGWFTSRRLLVPIGHASLAEDRRALRTDVSREVLRRFPEYDESRFREFTDDELRAFERNTVVACCPDQPLEDVSSTSWGYGSWRHYRQPDWWSGRYEPNRLRPLGQDMWRDTSRQAPLTAAGTEPVVTGAQQDRELVRAREDRPARDAAQRTADRSPHLDGRAQPGDVLGIETGGERTGIGETAGDENQRREQAERTVGRHEEDVRRSER